MFDTSAAGIQDLLRQGESQTVEFKRRLPPDEAIARVLSAFANTEGGILILGVEEGGEARGLSPKEVDQATEKLQRITSSLLPEPATIGTTEIEGKSVVYTVVPKASASRSPVMTSRGKVFLRQFAANSEVALSDLVSLAMDRAIDEGLVRPTVIEAVTAFVVMSFREEEEPALVDYYTAIERAVKHSGLSIELRRSDYVEGDYEISQQLMGEIDQADMVIADFTLNPRNVYFEAGYARGKCKRLIQTARRDTVLEFDVRNWRTVFYRNATELEQKLVPELRAAYAELRTGSS